MQQSVLMLSSRRTLGQGDARRPGLEPGTPSYPYRRVMTCNNVAVIKYVGLLSPTSSPSVLALAFGFQVLVILVPCIN